MKLRSNTTSGLPQLTRKHPPSNLEHLARFWIGLILAVIGLAVGAHKGWLYLQSSEATATVVEKSCGEGRNTKVCTVVLELETADGQQIRYEPPTGSRWVDYKMGDRKTVYYIPAADTESIDFVALENGLLPLLLVLVGGGAGIYSRAEIRRRKTRDSHAFQRALESEWASLKRTMQQQLSVYGKATRHSGIALLVTFAMIHLPFFSLGDADKGGWTLRPGEAVTFSVLLFIMISASAIVSLRPAGQNKRAPLFHPARIVLVFFCSIPILLLINFTHWLLVLIPLCLFIVNDRKNWWWALYDYCLGTFLIMMFSVSVSWENLFFQGLGVSVLVALLMGATLYISQRFGLPNGEQLDTDSPDP